MLAQCRRVLAVAVVALALPPVAAAQCGETRTASPGDASAQTPLLVGDSVAFDAAGPLASAGFAVNAMVCRQISQGIALLRARASLPSLVVVELGTNGPVTQSDIDQLLAILGPHRTLALVTPRGGVSPSVAPLMRAAAAADPGRIVLLDWERYSAGHPDWFAPDGVHLGGSAGIAAFTRLIASALPGAAGAGGVGTSTTVSPAGGGGVGTGTTATIPPPSTLAVAPPPPSRPRPRPRPLAPPSPVPGVVKAISQALLGVLSGVLIAL